MRKRREDTINSKVIKELVRIRKSAGVSKKALSELTGLSRRGIQLIEEEQRNPTLLSLLKLAQALNVDLGAIILAVESEIHTTPQTK